MIIQSIVIPNALRLDSQTIDSLMKGDIIAAIPRTFTNAGRTFALYPDQPDVETITISAWARCEQCDIVDNSKPLDIISHYTAISTQCLQQIIAEYESFFLIYLRVYRLSKPVTIPARSQGQYVALPDRLKVDDSSPVLSDPDFSRIKQKLENLEPPEPLDIQIQRLLDQAALQHNLQLSKELDWIEKIAKTGNSSDGHEFEKLVRKSFIHLGFSNSNTNPKASLDPEATGGAGGIDLCCEYPYPVVGECKASANQKIPTEVCSQLTYLGQAHFPNHYEKAVKIIIAAGSLNHHSNPVAIGNKMNVIRPETLEELVKLKLTHSGSINLQDLKLSLESEPFGEDSNSKILGFIEKAKLEIKLRSHIVNLVKNNHEEKVGVETLFGAYPYSNPPKPIREREELKDILIELSSPLAGYLGRVKGNGETGDRFYYLRDLPT
ncbi:DUF1802 family protein [Pseudanabaena galeata UHCC 0370]|uniref:DUF1802 family protein n=1 Tax=Pseudanabaena galeata UHCC 0370 TaxID=3110310 RepID=A0ABU5TH37_9CYAN|nr:MULTISPECIES: DUF1802 family protein [Pseudanabaena]MEA5477581.1 DUF1802 family protein [Pseudanabaena galeata UHCC 0370]MEA5486029.1 DUF1802 family protein [Pseudanabaena sp. CCNP1317]WGS73030.1 DUF1802 family protein [Pseudanabaena galeata CCNP1313]